MTGGLGGRSSLSGHHAAVFGCTGQLGKAVVAQLASVGSVVQCPYRGGDYETRALRMYGDNGRVQMIPFSPRDEDSIRAAMRNCTVVVNCIGKFYETKHLLPWHINYSLYDTHVEVAERIARIAKEEGVPQLVHVSSLIADKNSNSEWARVKAEGEARVRKAFPGATVIKPSSIYGYEDKFLNLFTYFVKGTDRIPLVNGGNTKVQPVWTQDVANAICRIIDDPDDLVGKTYELAGPDVYTHSEIIAYQLELYKINGTGVAFPKEFLKALAYFLEWLPKPYATRDLVEKWHIDDVLPEKKGKDVLRFEDLGLKPENMEEQAFKYLHAFKANGHFVELFVDLGGNAEEGIAGKRHNLEDIIIKEEKGAI
jgi:NADH dehydrogenase (ubiquinone) 1 alpha subcomplex subunit 9